MPDVGHREDGYQNREPSQGAQPFEMDRWVEIDASREARRIRPPARVDREIVADVGCAPVDAKLREPARLWYPLHPLVPAKIVEQDLAGSGAVHPGHGPGRFRQEGGWAIREKEDVGL